MLYNIVRFKLLIQLLGSQIYHLPFVIVVFPITSAVDDYNKYT